MNFEREHVYLAVGVGVGVALARFGFGWSASPAAAPAPSSTAWQMKQRVPHVLAAPPRVVEIKGKIAIDEHVGNASNGDGSMSVAHVTVSTAMDEAVQVPGFDEYVFNWLPFLFPLFPPRPFQRPVDIVDSNCCCSPSPLLHIAGTCWY